ncbi:nuclear transport factor 2 family protein [Dyella choica]|nr:nuclear transport factor 2 family protein [Dyella choica]
MYTALATLLLNAALPVIAATASASPASVPAAANDIIGQRLVAEERASWDLAIKRNADAYKALHASDFFTVGGAGIAARAPSEASAMDPNVRFDHCELAGFDVHFVAQDAALVTYHVKANGLDHGKTFQLDSYASSLWMKRNGQWLNVFYQATPTPKQ